MDPNCNLPIIRQNKFEFANKDELYGYRFVYKLERGLQDEQKLDPHHNLTKELIKLDTLRCEFLKKKPAILDLVDTMLRSKESDEILTTQDEIVDAVSERIDALRERIDNARDELRDELRNGFQFQFTSEDSHQRLNAAV